ncbi:MAG TPA: hypothetical protein V6D26_09945 [Stenomitos sp.]
MLRTAKKYPTRQMLQLGESTEIPTMTLDRFAEYWELDHQQLAKITRRSYSTVRKWFMCNGSTPDFEVLARLAAIHQRWLKHSN